MTTLTPERLPLEVRRQQALAAAATELGAATLDEAITLACAIGNMRIFEDDALAYYREASDLFYVRTSQEGATTVFARPLYWPSALR